MKCSNEAVVIGGSAGSIEALITILMPLPSHFTAPIIVVLHIASDAKTLLPEILASTCSLKIKEAESTEKLEAGTVYIAPPNYHLSIESDFTLALSNEEPRSFSRPSIDILFESAAEIYKNKVIGVLLSGANSDGAEGLKRIQALNGITIVQDPDTASFPDMPRSALKLIQPNYIMDPLKIGHVLAQSFAENSDVRDLR